MNLKDFDNIRPFEPEELPEVYDRMMADKQFQQVLAAVMPHMDIETIDMMMHRCLTNLDFQKVFCYSFMEDLTHDNGGQADHDNRKNSGCPLP